MSYQNTLINRATQRRPVQQQQPAPIGANENEYRAPGSGPSYGQTYGLIALGILLVAAFALIVALAVANGNSNEPYVNMDLIVDVPNVLSTDMNKAFTRNPFGWIPPDPHVAAGKDTVLVLVNSMVSIYDKHTLERLAGPIDGVDFFPGKTDDDFLFGDVYAVYDPFDERIWVNAFSFPLGFNVRLDVCVSKNASPRSGSDFFCYRESFPGDPFVDYPKISVDGTNVYIGSQDFDGAGGTTAVRVLAKQALIDGTSPTDVSFTVVPMSDLIPFGSGIATVAQLPWPARFEDTKGSDRLKQTIFASLGEETIITPEPRDHTGDGIDVKYLDGTMTPVTVRVPVPVYASSFDGIRQPLPLIPSSMNETLIKLEGFAGVLMSPVVRDDMLYAIHQIDFEERKVLRWYQVDVSRLVSHNEATLVQYGTIDDGINDLFYPSLAVDKHGNIAFGFDLSGPFQFVRPVYTVHMKGDPVGTVRFPLRDLAPGDHYYQADGGSGRNRYGDYSGMAVDPADHETFWIFNQYTYRVPQPDPRYGFGTAWNTKLGAFNPERTGGSLVNAPQTEHVVAGTAADVPPPARRRSARTPAKRAAHNSRSHVAPGERMNRHIQHHTPHGEGCHRVANKVVCPPMEGE